MKLRFRDCALDTSARALFHGGREVHLAPKAYDVLTVLIDGRPRALSKAELLERVWPGVFVADDSLAKVVSQLRKAIGDDDDAPIIRTVHGYGYAFVAAVDSDSAGPAGFDPARPVCWLFCDKREFPLRDGEHVIGRTVDADICLESPKVSRRHARLVVAGTRATIEDLGSKNGSFVKGIRISGPTALSPGDVAAIGPFRLRFHVVSEPGSTDTEVMER